MNVSLVSNALPICEIILCLATLACVLLRGLQSQHKFFCAFLCLRALCDSVMLPMLIFAGHGLNVRLAYIIYFYIYWVGFAAESVLVLCIIYSLFNLAMMPLDGLKKLGTIVFLWAAGLSLIVAMASVAVPHLSGRTAIVGFVAELQRTQSIITLCLLLFVCFAVRPMGLRYTSRIFGVSFGLGALATTDLVSSAWMAHFHGLFTIVSAVDSSVMCCVLLLWLAYFALPEPKRRMVVLPTTSPFFHWNKVADMLGDEPGFVAIRGIPPELFAPAEIEVMRRASRKMVSRPLAKAENSQTA